MILLKRAREKGYFIRCYYILTADPMINVWRVKARVESRIFKKRKELMYFDECDDWYFEDIFALTGVSDMKKKNLN